MSKRKSTLALLIVLLLLGAGAKFLAPSPAGTRMTAAAVDFVRGLNESERAVAVMPFDDPRRLDWHFIPKDHRKGLKVGDMSPKTRQRAFYLLQAALSATGYSKARTIMELESILHEVERTRGGRMIRDPQRYYFTLFGTPGEQETWGLSVEGHHLSLNFVVAGRHVSSHTPAMWGANPAEVKNPVATQLRKGHRTLAAEETLAFDLMQSLSPAQRRMALIADKAPSDIRGAAEPQPPRDPPQGLPCAELSPQQRSILWKLLEAYALNMPDEVARHDLGAIEEAGIEKVYFAWAGATEPGVGHYYCVQGPTFVLELCNVQPDSEGNPANHIHSVWRSASGDFGIPHDHHPRP